MVDLFDVTVFPEVSSQHPQNTVNLNNNGGSGGGNTTAYKSPVMTICNEVRRKNMAAAWSGPLSFHVSSSTSSTDPWENYQDPLLNTAALNEDGKFDETTLCNCSATNKRNYRKRSISRTSPKRVVVPGPTQSVNENVKSTTTTTTPQEPEGLENASVVDSPMLCPICGKRRPFFDRSRIAFPSNKATFTIANACTSYFPSLSTPLKKSSTKLPTSTVVISSSKEEEDPQHAKHLLETAPHLRLLSPQSTDMNGGYDFSRHHSLLHRVLLLGQQRPHLSTSNCSGMGGLGTSTMTSNTMNKAAATTTTTVATTATAAVTVSPTPQATLLPFFTGHGNPSTQRDRENQRAAAELASLLWTLSHEMSLEDFGLVESEIFTSVFGLVHDYSDQTKRLAGLAAVHALLAAPSADEEKKTIKFANALSQALRTAGGDFEFLSSVTSALGKMARRSANVDLGMCD